MLKRKKNIGLNEQRKIDELFRRHDWTLKGERYENFCSLGGKMKADEFKLLFELVDRFHLLDICNFMDEFLMGYYSCDDAIFQNAHSVIVTPMKEVDIHGHHQLKDKSGDVVFSMFQEKRTLCEYEEKIVFCNDAADAKNVFQDNDVICFVDDFVGTGKTYDDTYKSFVSYFKSQNIVIDNRKVFAVTAWAMHHGYDYCKEKDLRLFCSSFFDKAISESPNYTALEINYKKGLMVQMEKFYGNRITSIYSLGYMQSEALISIMDKSPNNTFPIFWKAKDDLNIFPRVLNNENRNKTSAVSNS